MPQYNHKKTGNSCLITSEIKILDNAIEVKSADDMPDMEVFKNIEGIPIEIIRIEKEALRCYFKDINQGNTKLVLTFLASGFPEEEIPDNLLKGK